MSKTKIVVLQMKQIIYTALLLGVGIILVIVLIFLLKPDNADNAAQTSATYNAGTYTSQISLNNTALNMEITVDTDKITSISLVNIDESIATMFPLLEPVLKEIEAEVISKQSTDNIRLSDDSRYTQTLLLDAIDSVLEKAKIPEEQKNFSASGSSLINIESLN